MDLVSMQSEYETQPDALLAGYAGIHVPIEMISFQEHYVRRLS